MIRLATYLHHDNINKVRSMVNGEPLSLNPITRMDLKIPSLDIVVTDSVDDSYPIKWDHTPEDSGLIEFQLGTQSALIAAFETSTSGDTEAGSQWITNVPAAGIDASSKFMKLAISDTVYEIVSVDRSGSRLKISSAAAGTVVGETITVYEHLDSSVHLCSLYVFGADYPNGIYFNQFELDVRR
jgi:hypothetical protein